ncbi:hypothetical protein ACEWY4_005642 [Coilia grayii]|uniref:Uncharacterized protein n=1 Tax=Coilia grayii TaxID=363190 RepID=A0ABD1KJ59_9TELE
MVIKTLNELDQLRLSHFGRPKPRHGLRLLFWFAHEFIEFDSNEMVATSQPHYGIFGFHRFHNWADNGDTLLPPQSFDYYEVGNLNETNSLDFPEYVREDHTGWQDDSNTDRIIVAMNGWNVDRVFDYYEVGNLNETNSLDFPEYVREDHTGWQDDSNTDRIIVGMDGWNVDRVYVTCHSDLLNFSRNDTYRISHGLINIIRRMSLERFLSEMDPPKRSYLPQSAYRDTSKLSFVQMQSADHTNVPIRNDSVKIAVVVIFMVFALWILCRAVW